MLSIATLLPSSADYEAVVTAASEPALITLCSDTPSLKHRIQSTAVDFVVCAIHDRHGCEPLRLASEPLGTRASGWLWSLKTCSTLPQRSFCMPQSAGRAYTSPLVVMRSCVMRCRRAPKLAPPSTPSQSSWRALHRWRGRAQQRSLSPRLLSGFRSVGFVRSRGCVLCRGGVSNVGYARMV